MALAAKKPTGILIVAFIDTLPAYSAVSAKIQKLLLGS
jgi:hypothetical protein